MLLQWNTESAVLTTLLLSCAVRNWLLTLLEWAWNQMAWSSGCEDHLDKVLAFWWNKVAKKSERPSLGIRPKRIMGKS